MQKLTCLTKNGGKAYEMNARKKKQKNANDVLRFHMTAAGYDTMHIFAFQYRKGLYIIFVNEVPNKNICCLEVLKSIYVDARCWYNMIVAQEMLKIIIFRYSRYR